MFEEIKKRRLLEIEKNYEIDKKTVEYVFDLIEANSLDKIFRGYSENDVFSEVKSTLRDLYLNYPFKQSSRSKNELSEKFGWEEFCPEPKLTEVGRAVLNQYRKFIGKSTIEEEKAEIEKRFFSLSDHLF